MRYLSLYHGALPTSEIYEAWEAFAREQNCGAMCVFTGIVRQEASREGELTESSAKESKEAESQGRESKEGEPASSHSISSQPSTQALVRALSFDVYEPLLQKWFESWQAKAAQAGAVLLMAHSVGDVAHTQSSYMCAIISKQRKAALGLYEAFIEDFKANAPIWKYDVIGARRVFALSRSTPIEGSGVLDATNHRL